MLVTRDRPSLFWPARNNTTGSGSVPGFTLTIDSELPPTKCLLQITVDALGVQSFLRMALIHSVLLFVPWGIACRNPVSSPAEEFLRTESWILPLHVVLFLAGQKVTGDPGPCPAPAFSVQASFHSGHYTDLVKKMHSTEKILVYASFSTFFKISCTEYNQ